MKIETSYEKLEKIETGLLVIILDSKNNFFDEKAGQIASIVTRVKEDFKNKRIKKEMFITWTEDSPVKNILIFWTGLSSAFDLEENVKIYAARALDICKNYGIHDIAFLMNTTDGVPFVGKLVEGAVLGAYNFNKYKKDRDEFFKDFRLTIIANKRYRGTIEKMVKHYEVLSCIANECRDIINEPGSVIFPEVLAEKAKEIGKEYQLEVTVLKKSQLEKEGYNGLLQVGKGSIHPPCMIMMQNKRKSRYHLGFIGKAITFDSGGISLKPSAKMYEMKGDMAGGAVVLYAMKAFAELGLPINITGIIPSAENMPDGGAQRPGDIFYAKNGKTIMVDNTDAEGRLILTDALYLAGQQKCTHIIDIATLTGACVRALGTSIAGILGTSKGLIQAVIQAGAKHGEGYWELPLIDEYKEMLKTPVADINNIGGEYAGAITAALFLLEFVPENTPWAHLDIAGPFLQSKPWKYYEAGATAFGFKTFIELAENFNKLFKH